PVLVRERVFDVRQSVSLAGSSDRVSWPLRQVDDCTPARLREGREFAGQGEGRSVDPWDNLSDTNRLSHRHPFQSQPPSPDGFHRDTTKSLPTAPAYPDGLARLQELRVSRAHAGFWGPASSTATCSLPRSPTNPQPVMCRDYCHDLQAPLVAPHPDAEPSRFRGPP